MKAFLGQGDSNLFKWMVTPFSEGDNSEVAKIHWKGDFCYNFLMMIFNILYGYYN